MASLNETYELDKLPTSSYDLIPDGWYHVSITKCDVKPTKDEYGRNVNYRFDIIGPTHQGRVLFSSINIKNQLPDKELKGRQIFGDIMRATGVIKATDTDQFIGKSLQIKVGNKEKTEEYPAKNIVVAYRAITGSVPPFATKETKEDPKKENSKAFWAKK